MWSVPKVWSQDLAELSVVALRAQWETLDMRGVPGPQTNASFSEKRREQRER